MSGIGYCERCGTEIESSDQVKTSPVDKSLYRCHKCRKLHFEDEILPVQPKFFDPDEEVEDEDIKVPTADEIRDYLSQTLGDAELVKMLEAITSCGQELVGKETSDQLLVNSWKKFVRMERKKNEARLKVLDWCIQEYWHEHGLTHESPGAYALTIGTLLEFMKKQSIKPSFADMKPAPIKTSTEAW
jgi:hypothetical protein